MHLTILGSGKSLSWNNHLMVLSHSVCLGSFENFSCVWSSCNLFFFVIYLPNSGLRVLLILQSEFGKHCFFFLCWNSLKIISVCSNLKRLKVSNNVIQSWAFFNGFMFLFPMVYSNFLGHFGWILVHFMSPEIQSHLPSFLI